MLYFTVGIKWTLDMENLRWEPFGKIENFWFCFEFLLGSEIRPVIKNNNTIIGEPKYTCTRKVRAC